MKMGVYAIKDTKIGFMNPWLSHNDQTAIRTYKTAQEEIEPNSINTNPEDKELWKLGTFNDNTGHIEAEVEFLMGYSGGKEE